jgi:hypothetical protein
MSAATFKRPSAEESSIVGTFSVVGGKVVDEPSLSRIKWLVRDVLQEVARDPAAWRTLYRDPETGELWELSFPLGEMQGGGPPTLSRIRSDEARERYPRLG